MINFFKRMIVRSTMFFLLVLYTLVMPWYLLAQNSPHAKQDYCEGAQYLWDGIKSGII